MLSTMTTPATLLEFGAIGDVPSILEIELPAILFNESLFIELNGSLTQLDAGSGVGSGATNNINIGNNSSSNSSTGGGATCCQ
ncbi:uncharacterized protein Dmoj_GI26346 [Drosophila mojavensis]|uniref:Uncharacterized protein n=1 Tax=Drosophila mojavensis TaxID=7230 RepID=A0A0Q9XHH6_DROMO|nr:uncharacterized protein Dmoj_GI26346 [Drosophila mojavensis]